MLNRSVGAILHLEDKKLTYYSGPYDQFARQRVERRAMQASLVKKQDARKAHLQSFVDRFRAKASKAKQAQARLKMIQRMEMIAPPEETARRIFSFPKPEELPPPIISIKDGQVGYDGSPVLKKLDLRIDQDDRIALLGRNGQGKSTLSKLLSDRLLCMSGTLTRSTKLRIGYFAQHQVEELFTDETPLQHLQRALSGISPTKLRAQLAGFGLGPDQADTTVERLSGGQKARLSLLLATLHAPHLLILDEPTNHLDIESREALVEALNGYSGAVILVSHDMHLLSLVADRLWLVKDGAVTPYEEDLETYRKQLLGEDKRKDKKVKERPKVQRANKNQILYLKNEVRKNEARLEKLNNMREKLTKKLATPELYENGRIDELESWNRKYAEVLEALERAEVLWIAAEEKLEKANSTARSVP